MNTTRKLLLSAAVVLPAAMALAPSLAQATPYAFASNQITNLTVTYSDGTRIPTTDISSASTNVFDSAVFGTSAPDTHQGAGVVGSALTIPQAFSGTSAAPPATFTPAGPGTFTGTRSDAAIGAGDATSGGVSVSNVAEGNGSGVGNSVGNNSSSITFKVVGTGKALMLSFTDAYMLTASTSANPNEVATSSITNSFSVTASGASTPTFTFQPTNLNQQVSSEVGVPPTNSVSSSSGFSTTTPVLTDGALYTISLSSGSAENLGPGVPPPPPPPIPEPASIAVLGAGLLGLGLTFRRKRR